MFQFLLWQAAKPSGGYECENYDGRGFFGQKISMVVCLHCHTVQPLTVGQNGSMLMVATSGTAVIID